MAVTSPEPKKNCHACAYSFMEPDSDLICGHPDSGICGLTLHTQPLAHCGWKKFEQHPRRNPDGTLKSDPVRPPNTAPSEPPMSRALFIHDCHSCVFLSTEAGHDLYYCTKGLITVVARYGSSGPEYISGLDVARMYRAQLNFKHPLARAMTLAEERGFLTRPKWVEVLPDNPHALSIQLDSVLLDLKLTDRPRDPVLFSHEIEEHLRSFVGEKCTARTLDAIENVLRAKLMYDDYILRGNR